MMMKRPLRNNVFLGDANERFRKGLTEQKLKSLTDKHPRPTNGETLQVPFVNTDVREALLKRTKKADLKTAQALQSIYQSCNRSSGTLSAGAEGPKRKQTGEAGEEVISKKSTVALALLRNASRQLVIKQRLTVRLFSLFFFLLF